MRQQPDVASRIQCHIPGDQLSSDDDYFVIPSLNVAGDRAALRPLWPDNSIYVAVPHTSLATSTTRASLRRSISSVTRLP